MEADMARVVFQMPRSVAAAALLLLSSAAPLRADGLLLQGIFCNSERQLDAVIAAMDAGVPPSVAVDRLNRDAILCTYIDLLHFALDRPVALSDEGVGRPVKHRAMLTGVLAGDRLRAVAPPVEVFFVTPDRLTGVAVERRS
jgi:hypothetical protein